MAREDVEHTDDGRHVVVAGRRWRATDPAIPDQLASELVSELMAARRAVGAAGDGEAAEQAARGRVQDAKVALGERGQPWWEDPEPDALRERLAATARALLRKRDADASICPSDLARVAGGEDWREVAMDAAREVAAALAGEEVVRITRGEDPVEDPGAPATWEGPVRLRRGNAFPANGA